VNRIPQRSHTPIVSTLVMCTYVQRQVDTLKCWNEIRATDGPIYQYAGQLTPPGVRQFRAFAFALPLLLGDG